MKKVQVPPSKLVVTVEAEHDRGHVVRVSHALDGIDRREIYGWSVAFDGALAGRMVRAIRDGAIFETAGEVLTDANGKSYLKLDQKTFIIGRTMSSQLKDLGY